MDNNAASGESRERGPLSTVRAVLGVSMTLAAVAYALDLFSRMGLAIYTEQFLATVLGISLALVFLSHRNSVRPRWYDWLAAVTGLACGVYLTVRYPSLAERQLDLPTEALVISVLLFFLVLEGLRRAVGLTLVLVVLGIVGYGVIGHRISGPLQTRSVDLDRMLVYMGLDPNGVLGLTLAVAPPIAIGAFFAASIAGADPMKTALTSMRLGWTAYIIPFLFVVTPGLLMMGSITGIILAVVGTIAGVWCVSVGFVGYLRHRHHPAQRCGFVLAGALFLVPAPAVPWIGQWGWVGGLVLALGLMVYEFRRPRLRQPAVH